MLADPGPVIWGGELVRRDGIAVGQVTSGAWGEALGAWAGLAYIRHPGGAAVTPGFLRDGCYEVSVSGQRAAALVQLRPPFDPGGDRIRGH